MIDIDALTPDGDGLVVGVVQDATTGAVCMVGYLDAEALERTRDTGFVHFFSRSRRRLWKKGETSGNTLALVSMTPDCDGDAVLIRARPAGPVCHTGTDTCFGDDSTAPTLGTVVDSLVGIVADRRGADPDESYTARLLADRDLAARKVLEEAGETAFALKDLDAAGAPHRVVEEAADLVYHLLAAIGAADVDPQAVADELRARMR